MEEAVRSVRKRNLLKAIMVKVAGLDSSDESIRQKVASELIEWELGTATKTQAINLDGSLVAFVEVLTDGDGE